MQIVGKNAKGELMQCNKPCAAICCDTCQAASIVEWEILRLDMRRDYQEWGMLTINRLNEMRDIATARDFINQARSRNAPMTRERAANCVTAGQCGQPDDSYFVKGKDRARRQAEIMARGGNPFWLGMSDDQLQAFLQAQESRATRTNKRDDDGETAMQDSPRWQSPKAASENFSNV